MILSLKEDLNLRKINLKTISKLLIKRIKVKIKNNQKQKVALMKKIMKYTSQRLKQQEDGSKNQNQC